VFRGRSGRTPAISWPAIRPSPSLASVVPSPFKSASASERRIPSLLAEGELFTEATRNIAVPTAVTAMSFDGPSGVRVREPAASVRTFRSGEIDATV
jgi:hypothetical protein